NGIAKATANIENPIAILDWQRRKNSFAVVGQPVDQDVLIFDEFRNKDIVPEIHILGTLHVRFDCAHGHFSQNVNLSTRKLINMPPVLQFNDRGDTHPNGQTLPVMMGSPAARHSGRPSSNRRMLKPRARSSAT